MSQLFDADSTSEVLYKCKDCPYPEIVYTTLSGEKKYTPSMIFAKDTMSLVDTTSEEVKVAKCSSCGRYFTEEALKNKLCPTCSNAEKDYVDSQSKKLYKKYKTLLPLGVRLFSLFSTKYCVEDDELIIFVLGKKKYSFNKLCVKEKGYFDKPRKMS